MTRFMFQDVRGLPFAGLALCLLGSGWPSRRAAVAAAPVRDDQLAIAPGPFQPTTESLKTVPVSRLVPRREVRHLGALGTAGRADGRRLVRPAAVRAGASALQGPPGALRPSHQARLQGHHPALEGREVGPRPADGALQEGRRALLRQHGLAPRQLLPLELDAPQVERREDGPAPRRRRRLAEGRQEARPAVRRLRAPGRQLHLVPGQPPLGQDGPAGRRALRRRRPEVRRTSITGRPRPATRAGTARTRAGTASGSPRSRTWSITTIPTCSTPTAACPSATRSA